MRLFKTAHLGQDVVEPFLVVLSVPKHHIHLTAIVPKRETVC